MPLIIEIILWIALMLLLLALMFLFAGFETGAISIDQIELVVLFEDLDTGWVGERLEVDRGRIDLRGHVHELDDGTPLRQIDGPDILHEAEVLVVDGDLHLLSRPDLGRCERGGDSEH